MELMNQVSSKDYEGIVGFGGGPLGTTGAVEELMKALGTTSTGGLGTSFGDGSSLRVQSLEATLKVITYTLRHIKLWKKIAKIPAYNTVEEYNRLEQYGGDVGAFFEEGGLPGEEDSTYSRQTGLVKFLGSTRVVTHPMTLIRPAHGDVLAREAMNGTSWIVGQLEKALFYGDDTMTPLAFKGITQQMLAGTGGDVPTNENVIDKRGYALEESDMEQVATIISNNYGIPSDLFLGIRDMANLAKGFFPKERVNLPAPVEGKVGVPLTTFASQAGPIEFNPSVFIRPGGAPKSAGDTGAPAAPAHFTTTAAGAPTTSMFNAVTPGGTFLYAVSSINNSGESLPLNDEGGTQVVANGDRVTFTITRATAAPAATAYKLYRSDTGVAADLKYFATVVDTPGGATQTNYDDNWSLPGTAQAFAYDMDPAQVMSFKQLLPLMKMPLAVISAAIRFMVLLYGVPQVYAPKKLVLIKNIGTRTT